MNFLKNFKEKRLLGGKLGSKNFYLNFIKRIRKRVDGMTRVGGTSWNKVNHVSGYRLSILPRPSVYTRRLMSRQGMYKSSGAQASSARIKVGSKLCSISKITTIIRHRECDIASVKPRAVTPRPPARVSLNIPIVREASSLPSSVRSPTVPRSLWDYSYGVREVRSG